MPVAASCPGSRRALRVAVVLFAIACRPPAPSTRVETTVQPPVADTIAVYKRVFEALYASGPEKPSVIVLYDSATAGTAVDCPQRPCPLSPSKDSHVSASALASYANALRQHGTLTQNLEGPSPILRISDDSLRNFLELGAQRPNDADRHGQYPDPFWDEFRHRFPGAWGLTSVTRIGFSDDGQQALLQVRHGCGGNHCFRMESMFLVKENGLWNLESRFPEQSDDWIGQGELRYVGTDSRMRAAYFRREDSTAKAIADSILRDAAPRRLRGTITSRKTGAPIPFAQIFVRSSSTYPEPWARVVADSLGRYEVRDLPLGGTMLEAQCPGNGPRPGATLDAPGLYVTPAMDTVKNLVAPDISPCWRSHRIFHLTSGWLESEEAKRAPKITADEQAIYAIVVNGLARRYGMNPVAIYNRSILRCTYRDRCGSRQLGRLVLDEVIDLSAIRDFMMKNRIRVALDPGLARRLRLRIVSQQDVDYLAAEALPFGAQRESAREDSALFVSALKQLHGTRAAVVSLGRIGFDSRRTRAIVEAKLDFDTERYAPSVMMILSKENGRWRVAVPDVNW